MQARAVHQLIQTIASGMLECDTYALFLFFFNYLSSKVYSHIDQKYTSCKKNDAKVVQCTKIEIFFLKNNVNLTFLHF